jgi:hypothetical protein
MTASQGGVKWGEFDRETQAFGLASTGGLDLHDRHRQSHPGRRLGIFGADVRPGLR